MNCPSCRAPMRSGVLDISRSAAGMFGDLLTGDLFSMPQYLHFSEGGDTGWIRLDTMRPAFRCSHCETLVIDGTTPVPAEPEAEPESDPVSTGSNPEACPACGAALTPEHKRCPECDIALR